MSHTDLSLFSVHRAVRTDEAGDFHGDSAYVRGGAMSERRWRAISAAILNMRSCRAGALTEREHMIDVVMPQMGESIVEGTLTKWLKKAGEHVERDEPLFEISTDKVDTEIPSPAAGTLQEVLVEEGKTVGINTVVATNRTMAARLRRRQPAAAPAADGSRQVRPPPQPQTPPDGRCQIRHAAATPRRRRSGRTQPQPRRKPPAAEAGSRRSAVSAGAQDGARIQYRSEPGEEAPAPADASRSRMWKLTWRAGRTPQPRLRPAASRSPRRPAPASLLSATPQQPPAPAPPADASRRTGQDARRADEHHAPEDRRAHGLQQAHFRARHHRSQSGHDQDREDARPSRRSDFQARYGFSLTFLPFVVRAAAAALRAFPIVNASIEGTNIIYHNEINIGIAVALEENGLIVPVIRNADEKNVVGLQRSIVDLATRARSRQLKPDEVQGGTFSITNFGSFGSVFATPVINQPQVAILGVGAVEKVPVVIDDAIAIRSVAYLALTFDHRLIDGALGDQFTQR